MASSAPACCGDAHECVSLRARAVVQNGRAPYNHVDKIPGRARCWRGGLRDTGISLASMTMYWRIYGIMSGGAGRSRCLFIPLRATFQGHSGYSALLGAWELLRIVGKISGDDTPRMQRGYGHVACVSPHHDGWASGEVHIQQSTRTWAHPAAQEE